MTPVEIIALIVVISIAIKLIVVLVKPKVWVDSVVKKIWVNPMVTGVISLILAAIVLYYLLQELTIIQIFAVMGLFALLAAISVAAYSKELIGMADKMMKNTTFIKKAWLSILVWAILIIWALKELFM